ncbi:hypothetical protein Tco_0745522, partial [Tanacetum coccineum]
MNVCDLEEEKRERSLDNNSYVSDQDMCFRKKGRREKTRSDRIFGKRKSDFEMGGPVFIGDKKVAVAGGGDGGLDGISRGVIGDNERVISNGEMVWIDVVFDGALGALGEKEVVMGEGVVVTSSSLEILTNNCLGGIMVSLIFLEGLDEEALVEVMLSKIYSIGINTLDDNLVAKEITDDSVTSSEQLDESSNSGNDVDAK